MSNPARMEWVVAERAPDEFLRAFPGTHPLVAQVLWARGYRDAAAAGAFLSEDAAPPDLFALPDMQPAVERLLRAIRAGERIAIYGDYDCDGVTSCALLMEALAACGAQAQVYIPDRFEEGYGLHAGALDKLKAEGVCLVVTVDCGARAGAEAAHAREIGLDLIITDHHELENSNLPDACAVINPRRADSAYPFVSLAGVGVAYRLAQALLSAARAETGQPVDFDEARLLDLVAIGTVADVVPLVGENRSLVQQGLRRINTQPRLGVRYLAAIAGAKIGAITSAAIGFALGPRLNAAGRIEHARDAYDLLVATDEPRAAEIARRLNERNEQRQNVTAGVARSAEQQALETGGADVPLLFAASEDYNAGVIGLAAARLMERYYKPAVVVATTMGEARGSCRSVNGFNITAALDQCKDLLARHGGHAAAAGFSTPAVLLADLRNRLLNIAREQQPAGGWTRALSIDAEINLPMTTFETWEQLTRLQPHGMGNPQPVFVARGLTVHSVRRVGRKHSSDPAEQPPHLQLRLRDTRGATWPAIGWRMGERAAELRAGGSIDVAFQLDVNEWSGERSLQLLLQDFRAGQR